jgi:uncharacterized membrane protein
VLPIIKSNIILFLPYLIIGFILLSIFTVNNDQHSFRFAGKAVIFNGVETMSNAKLVMKP